MWTTSGRPRRFAPKSMGWRRISRSTPTGCSSCVPPVPRGSHIAYSGAAMKCPFCSNMENKVIDSRLSKDGQTIRRRRECNDCGKRFTTYERIEEVLSLVVKADGRREPFDHIKLVTGIQQACQKRAVPNTKIEELVEDIEKQLQETGEKEVEASLIGEEVLV